MYFDKNMQALSKERRSQAIYQSLLQTTLQEFSSDVLAFFETDAGDYTLRYHGHYLHLTTGAIAEAKAICGNENQFHPGLRSNHILLGLGLGYLLDEAFRRSEGRIFVYEPNIPLLRFVFENVDLSEFISSQRVYFSDTMQTLFNHLKSRYIMGEALDVLCTQGYAALLAPEIPTLMEKMMIAVQEKNTNIGVGLAFHMDWLEHFIRNIPHFPQTRHCGELQDIFKGKPALVISSGPSLDDALPVIKANADRFITVAVGGALRPLLAAGVEPDFAVFLDFSGPEQQLTNLAMGTENIRFLCGPFVPEACFTLPAKARYLLSFANYPAFSDWLDQATGSTHYRSESGATVSVMAFEAAHTMGCNPLILCGQDLALKGKQYYAGSLDADIDEEGYVSLASSEEMVGRRLKLVEIEGQNGETLRTMPDYFAYKTHLEELAERFRQEYPQHLLYNASVGGALIQGFMHHSLAEILERHHFPVMEKSFSPAVQDAEKTSRQLCDALSAFRQALARAAVTAEQTVQHIQAVLLGQENPEAYQASRRQFSELLNAHPLLEYCIRKELWELQESFCFDPKNDADIKKNMMADERYFLNSKQLIENHLLQWVNHSLTQLSTQIPANTPNML